MEKKKQLSQAILYGALKAAAVDAYYNEVIFPGLYETTIGKDNEYPTQSFWMKDKIASWITEASEKLTE